MIDNYLEYCLSKRMYAAQEAKRAQQLKRIAAGDFCEGFYAGMYIAFDAERRFWRRLQKDIEVRLKKDHDIADVLWMTKQFDHSLTERGGTHGKENES